MDDGLLIRIKRFRGTSDELTPLEIQWQVVCYGWEAVGMSVVRSGLTRGGVLLKGEWSYKGVVLQGRLLGSGQGSGLTRGLVFEGVVLPRRVILQGSGFNTMKTSREWSRELFYKESGLTRKWSYDGVVLQGSGLTREWSYQGVVLQESGLTREWSYNKSGLIERRSGSVLARVVGFCKPVVLYTVEKNTRLPLF